jgi:hypothetical protein
VSKARPQRVDHLSPQQVIGLQVYQNLGQVQPALVELTNDVGPDVRWRFQYAKQLSSSPWWNPGEDAGRVHTTGDFNQPVAADRGVGDGPHFLTQYERGRRARPTGSPSG